MPVEQHPTSRRTLAPTVASVVVGIAVGIVAVYGLVSFSNPDEPAGAPEVHSSSAVLGGVEYGSRH